MMLYFSAMSVVSLILVSMVLVSVAVHTQNINIGVMLGMSVFVIGALRVGADDLTFSKEQASWFGGITSLMQLAGGFLYSFVRDAVSRKTFVLAMNIPQILAFLMMYFATSIYELLAAQAIIGISIGFMKAPLLSYLGEVLDPRLRGTIVSLSGVFLNFGSLLATFIGVSVNWRTMMIYISVMPVVSLILVSMIPNSPAWLVLKERVDDAEKAYQRLRGWVPASEVQEELTALVNYVKNKAASNNGVVNNSNKEKMNGDKQPDRKSKLDLFLHPSVYRPLRLVVLYMFTALCTSLYGMRSYFKEVATVIELPISADRALMCLNGLTMTGSLVASLAIRRLGKRGLTFMSLTLTTTSTLGLGLYVLLDCRLPWIPMVLFGTTYFGAYAGLLVIPWVLISEIFPLRTRSETTGVAISFCYLAMFIVVKTFYSIVDLLDLSGAFLFYGGVGVIGFIYLYFGLHETEGVPLGDIEALFIPENKSTV